MFYLLILFYPVHYTITVYYSTSVLQSRNQSPQSSFEIECTIIL